MSWPPPPPPWLPPVPMIGQAFNVQVPPPPPNFSLQQLPFPRQFPPSYPQFNFNNYTPASLPCAPKQKVPGSFPHHSTQRRLCKPHPPHIARDQMLIQKHLPISPKSSSRGRSSSFNSAAKQKKLENSLQRDLQASKDAVRRLGKSLPGNSKDEITRWIAERKRNWPSRKNVEEKLQKEREKRERGEVKETKGLGDAMSKLTEYTSSEEGEVKEVRKRNQKVRKTGANHEGRNERAGRKKRRSKNRNPRGERGGIKVLYRKPTLLRMLLDDEVRKEQNILLQALRHIAKRCDKLDKE